MKGLLAQYVYVAFVVATYWVVSICTVFVNKILLSGSSVNLDAPLFMAWFQCVVSACLCLILSTLGKHFPNHVKFPTESPLKRELVVKVIPLSMLFTLMITFNNLCLKYVDVGFYYIGRSLTTVFNVVLSYVILGQKTSLPTLVCCSVIVGGFWQGVVQEDVAGSLSISGMVYGILSSLFLSLYSIYTKRVLPHVNQEIWLLSYCNNVYSCILFLPLILINKEIPEIYKYEKIFDVVFWTLMCIGGICGFAIGFVTALQIKVTSPLTHNISATAKSCAQTVLASYIYREIKPWAWWISNWVVLGGSAAYTWVKQREMEASYVSKPSVNV
ncbi:Uncharacterized protein GBIM_19953 [Gryllus bimaculatus]|nr:Uncharacterized protein GBIM_19953 [Gryllus bimaculatus]